MKHEITYRKSMTGGIICQFGHLNIFIDKIRRVNCGDWLALHSIDGQIIGMAEGKDADQLEAAFHG
jgi:hypothetical protein